LIGNLLDKYEVLQKIGEGGMATVYKGRHVTLGREVAIKVLHPHLSSSEKNRQRFAREARAIEHLEHENILKIFDYSGTDTDRCYIVTELVDGATLQELVTDRARIPSEVATLISMRLARALEYAHELGIIHRDLKLENVMLRRDGTLKLMDFGIARFLDEMNLTITGALVGSPAYMSPEQAMERVLDARSDLFSLGTLLFHLVTGQLPFTGSNPSIILRNIIEGNRPGVLELAPDISGKLADLIERLLQVDPGDRIQTAAEAVTQLQACIIEVGIDPAQPTWALQAWLLDPNAYEEHLRAHLGSHLLELGKVRLVDKDHLGALRLFNRLLSMDDQNEEVMELVQSMHGTQSGQARPGRRIMMGLGLLLSCAGFAILMWPEPTTDSTTMQSPSDRGLVLRSLNSEANDIDAPPSKVATGGDLASRPRTKTTPLKPAQDRRERRERRREAAEQSKPGSILITVPGSWGDIYIDGKLHGRTGSVGRIEVQPGTHTLRIENEHALPYKRSFTVAPGEDKAIEVTSLKRKPASYRLQTNLDGDCTVLVDGIKRGSLGGLKRTVRVPDPGRTHALKVHCPDGTEISQELPALDPGTLMPVTLKSP
jgi:serine/threonine-protein kinase